MLDERVIVNRGVAGFLSRHGVVHILDRFHEIISSQTSIREGCLLFPQCENVTKKINSFSF